MLAPPRPPPAYSAYAPSYPSYPPQSYGPPPPGAALVAPRVGLNAAATRHAWKFLGASVLGFVLSIVIVLVGAVTGILLLIGIPLFFITLVAIPIAIFRLFDPTKTRTLARLGPTAAARRQMLDQIDADVSHPGAWKLRAGPGTLYVTPRFVVYDGSTLDVVRTEDIVWYWPKEVRTGRIIKSVKPHVCFKTRAGDKVEMEVFVNDQQVMPALAHACPYAFAGWSVELDRCGPQQLAYEVDRRRAAR